MNESIKAQGDGVTKAASVFSESAAYKAFEVAQDFLHEKVGQVCL
jgi:hypothetical protein